jgi:hypothetical protein
MITTYQNSNNTRISLSDAQIARLEDAEVWLRDEHGYLTGVHYGRHHGRPTLDDADVDQLIAGEEIRGLVAR